jgi:hypothetical protein
VRALCDVGRSTKSKKSGYIGQKGIGFKSVFRITDAPQIHSAGFHIAFDISQSSLGYILPSWVGPNPKIPKEIPKTLNPKTKTPSKPIYSWKKTL